ncbi:MAG TPA: hypothetical protein VFU72_02745 [Nitrolancea sp.]|nr:hypothetical protein [Nitrolancea sp.]
MPDEVPARDQLVVELHARDLAASRAVYQRLGFRVTLGKGNYVELAWGRRLVDARLGSRRLPAAATDRHYPRHGADGRRLLDALPAARPDGLGPRFASRLPM